MIVDLRTGWLSNIFWLGFIKEKIIFGKPKIEEIKKDRVKFTFGSLKIMDTM